MGYSSGPLYCRIVLRRLPPSNPSLLPSLRPFLRLPRAVFPRDEEYKQLDVLTPRLLYCLVHAGQLVFGLYKLSAMRLLPSASSDFISIMPVPPVMEHAYPAL